MEIDSIPDWICNVLNSMKTYFFTKSEIQDNYSEKTHTHPIDNVLKSNSTNPVQNKVIKTALDGKSDTSHTHSISEVNSLQSELDDKADVVHTHNNYVTATQLNNGLAGKSDTNHSHSNVSSFSNGFMSSDDKTKLDGIAANANKTVVDNALSNSSTNPVQNKVIYSALNNKADKTTATESSNGLMSYEDKSKLDSVFTGARAKKRILGFFIYSDVDQSNQPIITIKQGTRLKVRLYESEDYDGTQVIRNNTPGINFPPNLTVLYTIHGVAANLVTNNTPASLNVGLDPDEYTMHFAFSGSGNFYPVYRSLVLKVIE